MVKYRCPVPGCNFETTNKNAIVAHIYNTKDDEHQKLRGPDMMDKIEVILDNSSLPQSTSVTRVDESDNNTLKKLEDEELLRMAESFSEQINALNKRIDELTLEVELLKKRIEVHKQVLLKIFKALGVE